MTQAGDRESYRRAFAAATVHDMFNWLSVIVLTILELSTGFLEISSEYMVNHMIDESNTNSTEAMKKIGKGSPDFLKPLTKPLTNLVVQVDKKVLLGWSFQVCILKSVNLQYIMLGCLDDGTNESSTKSLMFQVLFLLYFL